MIKKRLMNGTKASDIAIYINSMDEYIYELHKIFDELNIPLRLPFDLPLRNIVMIRDFLKILNETLSSNKKYSDFIKLTDEAFDTLKSEKNILSELKNEDSYKDNLEFIMRDYKAMKALGKIVRTLKKNYEACGLIEKDTKKDQFIEDLLESVNNATITLRKASSIGVKVINTDLARGVKYDTVFILGINEGKLPYIGSNDLFSDIEISELKEKGLDIKDFIYNLEMEKARFILAISSASKEVFLSYRTAEEDGSFAIQSIFIDELKNRFSKESKDKNYSMRDRFSQSFRDSMSIGEAYKSFLVNESNRLWLDKENKDWNLDLIRELSDDEASTIELLGLIKDIEYNRYFKTKFDNYDGIVNGEALPQNSEGYNFSASQLNAYFSCPFKYMLQRVFGITDIDEDEDQYTNLDLGGLYHRILERYFKEKIESCKAYDNSLTDNFQEVDLITIDIIIQKEIDKMRDINQQKSILSLVHNEIKENVISFLNYDIKRLDKFSKEQGKDKILRPYKVEYKIDDPNVFGDNKFRGSIDRIDIEYMKADNRWIPTGKFIICDYKKKSVKTIEDFLKRRDCQVAVYYETLKTRLLKELQQFNPDTKDIECMGLMYLGVERDSKGSHKADGIIRDEYKKALNKGSMKLSVTKEVFELLMEYMKDIIEKSIEDIKQGKFNPTKYCTYYEEFSLYSCMGEDVCRYDSLRMAIKVGEDNE